MGCTTSSEYTYTSDLFPSYIRNSQGFYLYTKQWKSTLLDNNNKNVLKGVVFICHGFGEHILRYEHVAQYFNNNGYDVIGMDHQSMGQSESHQNIKCDINSFEDFVNDYINMVHHFININHYSNDLPKFLLGHSLGGLISAHVGYKEPKLFNGIILSAPALAADPSIATPFNIWLGKNLESIFPTLEVEHLSPDTISRNKNCVRHYINDPLVFHGGLRVKFGNESLLAMNDIHSKASQITYPILIMHGTADKLTQISGSKDFINSIKSTDKKMVELEGFFHEIMREPGYEKILMEMLEWIENHNFIKVDV